MIHQVTQITSQSVARRPLMSHFQIHCEESAGLKTY